MSLYNKYRPNKWKDIIGQNLEKEILTKAIGLNKIFHSILLVGPKGSGKTTIARLIAQSVNCTNKEDFEPCEKCDNCIAISSNRCLDIHELDAASNGGVDDIRRLKEESAISSKLPYQVWIIDECHMLTKSAWNAFLKTLEEPHENTVFILATTEKEKVPETILSRCSIFNLKKIDSNLICSKLIEICNNENIKYEESAIKTISVASNGGMRNALVFLDQAFVMADDYISNDIANKITFSIDSKITSMLLKSLLSNNPSNVLLITSLLDKNGICPKTIFQDLLDALYGIMVYKITGNKDQLVSKNILEDELIEAFDLNKVRNTIEYLVLISKELEYNPNPRYFVDIVFQKCLEKFHH